jgi:protocatechuate 3,4-dioxygenase beta subunit
VGELDHDLPRQHSGEPIGERMVLHGRVIEADGRPVPHTLIEVWQANSCGRYWHQGDQHPAPLDPNFTGLGRCLTDDQGRYRFVTIKPGAYPWGNHENAWRPQHIHFSLLGRAFTQRLITQMYFPGDPLLADSTHVVLTEAPTVLADPIALRNRWTDEAVLDSAAADATAAAIADALRTLVPELRSLLRRLQEIAQALKARRDAAGER